MWSEVVNKILALLTRLPELILAYKAGEAKENSKTIKAEREKAQLQLKLEQTLNESEVNEILKGKSNSDIVDDAIAEGQRFRELRKKVSKS